MSFASIDTTSRSSTSLTTWTSLNGFLAGHTLSKFLVPATLSIGATSTSVLAFLDSGADDFIMDITFAKTHSFPLTPLTQPIPIELATGELAKTSLSHVSENLTLTMGSHVETITCKVGSMAHDLTLPLWWCERHNPKIDWRARSLRFDDVYCLANCLAHPTDVAGLRPVSTLASGNLFASLLDLPDLDLNSTSQSVPLDSRPSTSTLTLDLDSENSASNEQSLSTSHLPRPTLDSLNSSALDSLDYLTLDSSTRPVSTFSFVSGSEFNRLIGSDAPGIFWFQQLDTGKVKILDLPPSLPENLGPVSAMATSTGQQPVKDATTASIVKEHAKSTIPLNDSGVPLLYSEFADVFDDKAADTFPTSLPPHRDFDLTIDLIPDAPLPPIGRVYPLAPAEHEALEKYIQEALAKGWIRPSNSPVAAPCFYVPKPNGGLRLCVDYRRLNAITKRDYTPMPLVEDVLARLSKAKIYTKLDLRNAYHLVRVKNGDEWKTAFRCRFGQFEYLVIPFGLTNAPAVFTRFIQDIFKDLLDISLFIYLDDLLICSDNERDHEQHVREILRRCRKHHLYVKASKCSFHCTIIDYLGFILSPSGLAMDPAKIASVRDWPTPTSVKEIQSFLGFCNFYRRFISDFGTLARPLTQLTRKTTERFVWTSDTQLAFDSLKARFTSGLVLRHFDPSLPCVVDTDASDFAIGASLSQPDPEGSLRPVAFYSRQLSAAELNYDTHDKELLAIVDAFRHWRHFLLGSPHTIRVRSDHRNLTYFLSRQLLNRRQARWALDLADFSFTIEHVPGSLNSVPDALSRRPDYQGGEEKHINEQQRTQALLDGKLTSRALTTRITSTKFLDDIRDASTAAEFQKLQETFSDDELEFKDGLIFVNGLLFVPDANDLRLQILQDRHDAPTAGHFGTAKTFELVSRDYSWPGLRQMIKKFVKSCDTCQRNKTTRHLPHGLLQPLPVPDAPWSDVTLDFIVELPPARGYNAVLVFVDRFTKMVHFAPCSTNCTAEQAAQLYLDHVFRLHGLPVSITSDRGPQFVAKFWNAFHHALGTKVQLATSRHPQTDGQTERVNQILEQYLRCFVNDRQDNWPDYLALAEFAINNTKQDSIQATPFYANYGRHPIFDPNLPTSTSVPAVDEHITQLQNVHADIKATLRDAIKRAKLNANEHRKAAPDFKVGDKVWLSRKGLPTRRPSDKLDERRIGPFKIIDKINNVAFKLELPNTLKTHPVFHVSLLEPHVSNPFPSRKIRTPPPISVDTPDEFVVDSILDVRNRRGHQEFLIHWLGYPHSDDSWEPFDNLNKAAKREARALVRSRRSPRRGR